VDLRWVLSDITSDASIENAVRSVISASGRIDVLIHNAGRISYGFAEGFTSEQMAQLFEINVIGTQRLNRAALPYMRRDATTKSSREDGSPAENLVLWVGSCSTREEHLRSLVPILLRRLLSTRWRSLTRANCHNGASRRQLSFPVPTFKEHSIFKMECSRQILQLWMNMAGFRALIVVPQTNCLKMWRNLHNLMRIRKTWLVPLLRLWGSLMGLDRCVYM
jgi:hypothetical protein